MGVAKAVGVSPATRVPVDPAVQVHKRAHATRFPAAQRTPAVDAVVLITEATRGALSRDAVGWEERPGIELKGKAREVVLYGPPTAAEAVSRPDPTA